LKIVHIKNEIGDGRGEGQDLGNMGLAYSDLSEPGKAIAFLKESLAIGKSIEDPRIINSCEQTLKELGEFSGLFVFFLQNSHLTDRVLYLQ